MQNEQSTTAPVSWAPEVQTDCTDCTDCMDCTDCTDCGRYRGTL